MKASFFIVPVAVAILCWGVNGLIRLNVRAEQAKHAQRYEAYRNYCLRHGITNHLSLSEWRALTDGNSVIIIDSFNK